MTVNTNRILRAAIGIGLAACLAACAGVQNNNVPRAERISAKAQIVSFGPKKTVAVDRFDAHGAFQARYGGYDVGGGLAAQLASTLEQSGHFVLVERASLSGVLREQELAAAGLAARSQSARAGQLVSAQYLVRGSVTEFGEANEAGGLQISGPLSSGFGGALGTRARRGHVAIDLRVIDTSTGEVVATRTVERKLQSRSLALSGSGNASFSVDGFQRSPLGRATRDAMVEAVAFLATTLGDAPWRAHVAKVEGERVFVNAGAKASLMPGDTFAVYRATNRVTDPISGEVLGSEERKIGVLVLGNVESRYSVGTYAGDIAPRVGDVLRDERTVAWSGAGAM